MGPEGALGGFSASAAASAREDLPEGEDTICRRTRSPAASHRRGWGDGRLAVGGAWRLATGGWWRFVVVGGGWWLVAVGGW